MWTPSLDGQVVRGRQTGAGTLIYFVTTEWPSGLTGIWKKGLEWTGVGERGVCPIHVLRAPPPCVGTWKPPVPQQLQSPCLKALVPSLQST